MFSLFCKKPKEKNPTVIKDIEVEDLTVRFTVKQENGIPEKLTKKFLSGAYFRPSQSSRGDGVVMIDADLLVNNYFSWFKSDGFKIIQDTVVRFEDFQSAEIVRTKRSVKCRALVKSQFD